MSGGEQGGPKVSVIISTYERPAYLKQAVESVYAQTFQDFEIIVVDDGSAQETVALYELGDRARLIRHERSRCGCAATKNTGARAARGQYLAFLDDDDLWLPHKLQSQVDILDRQPEVGLVYGHFILVDQDLQPLKDQPKPKAVRGSCLTRLIHGNFIKSPSVVMMRREVIEKCGGFREDMCGAEDWEMWTRAAACCQFQSDPDPLILYRTHPGQMTLKMLTSRRADVQAMERLVEWAMQHAPGAVSRLRSALCFRLQRLSRWEATYNGYGAAARVLARAISVYPWDPRSYLRLLTAVRYALRRREA